MHSSRMRTAPCWTYPVVSLSGGGRGLPYLEGSALHGGGLPYLDEGVCMERVCLEMRFAWRGVCLEGCLPSNGIVVRQTPLRRQTLSILWIDKHLWKHYLPHTPYTGGNYVILFTCYWFLRTIPDKCVATKTYCDTTTLHRHRISSPVACSGKVSIYSDLISPERNLNSPQDTNESKSVD